MNLVDRDIFLIDDFLFSEEEKQTIQRYFESDTFPWYLNGGKPYTASKDWYNNFLKVSKNIVENNQLFHSFLYKGEKNSDLSVPEFILTRIQSKYNISLENIYRIKANLCSKICCDNDSAHQTPHVDTFEKHLVIIYYINDSDGDTFVFKESFHSEENIKNIKTLTVEHRISPKQGRIAIFNGSKLHAGMHPKVNDYRMVINFNLLYTQ